MFMVINKDKVVSYLISLSTVAMLFIFSFMISRKNDEIIKTSTNVINSNNIQQENSLNNSNSQQTYSKSDNNSQQTYSKSDNKLQQTNSSSGNNSQQTNSKSINTQQENSIKNNNKNVVDAEENYITKIKQF